MMRRSLLLAAGLAAATAACTAPSARPAPGSRPASMAVAQPPPTAAELKAISPAALLLSWGRAGSAIRLSHDTYLTCRHVLPRRGDRLEHAGAVRSFTVLARGESDRTVDDWAVVRLDPAPTREPPHPGHPPVVLDPTHPVSPGDTVHLVGYWRGQRAWLTRDDVRRLEPTVATGRVVPVRDSAAFPRGDILFVETEAGDIFPGMSGGPALVYDARNQRLVVVGMYVGAAEYEPGQSRYRGSVQIIRRIPQPALATVAPPP